MMAGANMALVLVMVAVGYSDRLNPADHPILSCVGMTFPVLLLLNLFFLFFWITFKWRMTWIPVMGYLAAYVPIRTYLPLNVNLSEPEGETIKLISYNVFGYNGNDRYADGLTAICQYLRDEQPDIACLQEDGDAGRELFIDAYRKLFAYNDTAHCPAGVPSIGIHTRFPIIRKEHIPYRSEFNGSVAWYLKVGNDTLLVINNHFEGTHLSVEDRDNYQGMIEGRINGQAAKHESKKLLVTLAEASARRAPQIDAVCRYVEAHRQYPTILCGDFNDNPISYSHYKVSTVLQDCFTATGNGLGWSYNKKGFYFRIDHVFCSDDVHPYNCKVDNKITASDHYPVICHLKIGGKP